MTYHIQPMTGRVHTDPECSMGTARYGTGPATIPDAEVEQHIAEGRLTACKRCVTPAPERLTRDR